VHLGLLLAKESDLVGARAAFQQAIDSYHPEAAASTQQALQNLTRPGTHSSYAYWPLHVQPSMLQPLERRS
jgi:hypothetical protein